MIASPYINIIGKGPARSSRCEKGGSGPCHNVPAATGLRREAPGASAPNTPLPETGCRLVKSGRNLHVAPGTEGSWVPSPESKVNGFVDLGLVSFDLGLPFDFGPWTFLSHYRSSVNTDCGIRFAEANAAVPDWKRIWFFVKVVVSSAKLRSRMMLRAALRFSICTCNWRC